VTDHIWTIAELLEAALEPSDVPPLLRPVQPRRCTQAIVLIQLVVIKGRKIGLRD